MSAQHTKRAITGARMVALLALALPALLTPGCGAESGSSPNDESDGEGRVATANQGISTGYTPLPTTPMGSIQGSFSVDEKGGAAYSMPLNLPPGSNGVEPKLSLVYNSRQQNGMLGMRVSLGGLSNITRCPQTKAVDGSHGTVTGGASDVYCLDGQRIIQTSGTYNAADGAEYRTEIDNGSRIVSRGECDSGPCGFEVTDAVGNRAFYGYDPVTFGSQNAWENVGQSAINTFAIYRLESPNGAYYSVDYFRDAGQIYPSKIAYTKRASVALNERRVTFLYEDRPDWQTRYVNGTRYDMKKRLTTIRTSIQVPGGADRVAREYRLAYIGSPATRNSLIDTVSECDALGACLPPTRFQWKSDAQETFFVSTPWGDPFQTWTRAEQGAKLITGDFNGDGKADFIRQEINGWAHDQSNNFNVYLSRGDGGFDVVTPTDTARYRHYKPNAATGVYEPRTPEGTEFQTWLSGHWGANIIPGDFNGDGKTDFIRQEHGDWANDTSNNFNVYLSKGDGYFDVYTPGGTKGYSRWKVDANMVPYTDPDCAGRADCTAAGCACGDEFQAWASANYGSRLIPGDFNGDGKTDFIRQEINGWGEDGANNFNVYLSQGNGHFDVYRPTGSSHDFELSGTRGVNIIPGDFNGDGKTDFIRQEFGDWDVDWIDSFSVYFSLGNGRFDRVLPAGNEYQDWLRFDPGATIITGDFNGDGKTDFLRQEHGEWANNGENTFQVYFSRGDGYFDVVEPQGDAYQKWLRDEDRPEDRRGAKLIPGDFNGDGKTDFLRQEFGAWASDALGTFHIYLSRGDGYFDVIEPPGADFQNALRYDHGAYIIPGDFDGDGKTDFLRQIRGQWAWNGTTPFTVNFAKGLAQKGPNANTSIPADIAPVDQAVVITNGLGGKVNIRYAPIGTQLADASKMRGELSGMFVVDSTSIDDGTGAAPVDRDYFYHGPVIDPNERGFMGFMWYRERIMSTGVETYWNYNTTYPLHGMLENTTTVQPNQGSKTEWRSYVTTQPYTGVNRVRLNAETTDVWWGVAPGPYLIRSSKEHYYDTYGNRQISVIKPQGGNSAADYFECVDRDIDVAQWRIDLPKAKWVGTGCALYNGVCGCSTTLEKTEWTRDAKTNITQTRRWISGGAMLATNYTYDELGNVLTKTEPTGVTTALTYDDEYRTYPMVEVKSGGGLSETTSYDYEPRFGKRVYTRNPNGHEQWTLLDGLGREMGGHERDPQGAVKLVSLIVRDAAAKWKKTLTANDWSENNWRDKIEYLDGFERVVKEETVRPGGNILVERFYDEVGRVAKESMPRLATETPRFKDTKFDILGRVTESVVGPLGCAPANGCVKTTVAITHDVVGTDNWRTAHATVNDGTSTRPSHEWRDTKGRVIKRADSDNRETTFTYDVFDRKTSATDGTSPVTITYDGLGNITQTSSYDRGIVTHVYSATTGLLSSSNDNGQLISYQYDGLGRMSVKTVAGKSTTTYTYDTPQAGMEYGKGRITLVEIKDAAGVLQSRYAFSYDKAGRTTAERVTVDNETYTIKRTYDPTGRPLTVTFPDNTTLTSEYLSHGPLARVKLDTDVYAEWSGHNAEGQPSSLVYKNGTSTTYGYDASRRLNTLRTTGPNNTSLLDYTYAWDAASRVSGITDNRASGRNQSFRYSDGGSLTYAEGIYGKISYTYDTLSNLTNKVEVVNGATTTVTYTYTGHRVTGGGGQSYGYNAGGDRVSTTSAAGTTTYSHDGEHRIVQITGPGNLALGRFGYDFEGERVLKVDKDGTKTLYIAKEYEVLIKTDGTHLATKYLTGPAGRVAAISANITAPTAMLDVPQDSVRAAFGVIMDAPRRLGAMATAMLAFGVLALAYGLSRVRVTKAGLGRAAARARALLLPPATAWAKKHPVFAACVPVVMLTFLSACAPGRYEDSPFSHTEDALTAGANGAGNPVSGTYFFHQNHLGSSSLITNASGAEIARAEYKPYGELINDNVASPGQDIFRAKFTGKELDADSGLYYYSARYYDPVTGRFMTADKYLHGAAEHRAASLNPYAYTDNNPVMYVDPSGHFAFVLIALIAVGAAAGAYMGGQATNGTWDPSKWSLGWKTWLGVTLGALAGGAAGYGAAVGGSMAVLTSIANTATMELLRIADGNDARGVAVGIATSGLLAIGGGAVFGTTGFMAKWGAAGLTASQKAVLFAKEAGKLAAVPLTFRAVSQQANRLTANSNNGDDHAKGAKTAPVDQRVDLDSGRDRGSNALLFVK